MSLFKQVDSPQLIVFESLLIVMLHVQEFPESPEVPESAEEPEEPEEPPPVFSSEEQAGRAMKRASVSILDV